jgi:WD40 repeat protein
MRLVPTIAGLVVVVLSGCAAEPSRPIRLPVEGVIAAIALSDDGLVAAALDNGEVRIWDISSRKEVKRLMSPSPEAKVGRGLLSVFFDKKDHLYAHCYSFGENPDPTLLALDFRQAETVEIARGVTDISLSVGGRYAALLYPDHRIVLQDLCSRQPKLAFKVMGKEVCRPGIAISKSGSRVCVGVDGQLVVYNAFRGTVLSRINVGGLVGALTISPDGEYVADTGQRVWRLRDGKMLVETESEHITFTPDSRYVIAGGQKGLLIWDISKQLTILSSLTWGPVAVSRDGKYLASTYIPGEVGVWEIEKLITEQKMDDGTRIIGKDVGQKPPVAEPGPDVRERPAKDQRPDPPSNP